MERSSLEEHEDDATDNATFAVGSEGIWTFVFIDMVVFGLIFMVYSSERVHQYTLYEQSQGHLNPLFGFVNTLVLLTSSLAVVKAVQSAREGRADAVRTSLAAALALGCVFLATKFIEYSGEFASGISVATNSFFTFYFFITFVHLMHVLAGMTYMTIFRRGTREADTGYVAKLESLGTFWHFVDLLWVFIYALLYLM